MSEFEARAAVHSAAASWSLRSVRMLATIVSFGEPEAAQVLNLCVGIERDKDPGDVSCIRPKMPPMAQVLAGMLHVYRELGRVLT